MLEVRSPRFDKARSLLEVIAAPGSKSRDYTDGLKKAGKDEELH